jgi:hypothetical protein
VLGLLCNRFVVAPPAVGRVHTQPITTTKAMLRHIAPRVVAGTRHTHGAAFWEEKNAIHASTPNSVTFEGAKLRMRLRGLGADASKNHDLAARKSLENATGSSSLLRAVQGCKSN